MNNDMLSNSNSYKPKTEDNNMLSSVDGFQPVENKVKPLGDINISAPVEQPKISEDLRNFATELVNKNNVRTIQNMMEMANNYLSANNITPSNTYTDNNFMLSKSGMPVINQKDLTEPDYFANHSVAKNQSVQQSNLPTGYASPVEDNNKFNKKTNMQKSLMYINKTLNQGNKESENFMNDSIIKLDVDRKKTDQYKIHSASYGAFLNYKYNLNGTNKVIPSDWKGKEYTLNSEISKKISNLESFQNQIKSKYNKEHKTFLTNKIEIDFKNDKDLALALGHCTVLEPKVKNGYIEGVVFDKYDFDYIPFLFNKKNKNSDLDFRVKSINNATYFLQEHKMIDNYYVLIPFKFKL